MQRTDPNQPGRGFHPFKVLFYLVKPNANSRRLSAQMAQFFGGIEECHERGFTLLGYAPQASTWVTGNSPRQAVGTDYGLRRELHLPERRCLDLPDENVRTANAKAASSRSLALTHCIPFKT